MAIDLAEYSVVGMLGDVIFTTSARCVKTIQEFEWDSSAKYAEHEIYNDTTQLEYVGTDADKINLSMRLSRSWGVEPLEEIVRLFGYEREGKALPLVLGEKAYGKCAWVILNTKRTGEYFDGKGNLADVTCALELKAYED